MKESLLSIEDVRLCYKIIKDDIHSALSKSQIGKVYSLIDTYAVFSQTINDHFYDADIEEIINEIGNDYVGKIEIKQDQASKKIVFYDQIGTTICLGLQYLRGLKSNGYEIYYVFESPNRRLSPALLKEVEEICVGYSVFERQSSLKLAKKIQSIIAEFSPRRLIAHFSAEGALGNSVISSLIGVEKYRIVPGDHHYSIGVSVFNHFFEYRNFAIKVAVEERGIPKSKIYKLPYYPIINNTVDFMGFPEKTKGKTIIMAAGSEYKFHGSPWFFEFSNWILKKHKNAVIVFLGGKSSQIEDFVKKNHLEDSFLLLGYRHDFVECMKHVDIFLNSYPMGGGLVGLTAINLNVPVLSHYDEFNGLQNSIRSFLGAEDIDSPISYCDDELMKIYASKLISDEPFRKEEGRRMHSMAQTKENFDSMLGAYLLGEKESVKDIIETSCFLDKRTESYLCLQNEFLPTIINLLIEQYGVCYLKHFPFLSPFENAHSRVILGWKFAKIASFICPESLYNLFKSLFKRYFV